MSSTLIPGKNESLIGASVAFGILATLAMKTIPYNKKPAQIALFLQFVFCALTQLTAIFVVGVPSSNCRYMTMAEFLCYNLFMTSMESVLMFRGMAFTRHATILRNVTFTMWFGRLGMAVYQISTIKALSGPNEYCAFSADFSISIYQLWLQIITEIFLLLPFLEKMVEMLELVKYSDSNKENKSELLKLSIHNTLCTVVVIVAQFICTYLTGKVDMFPYMILIFAATDLVQAFAVMNAMEVMKSSLTNIANNAKRTGTSSMSTSRTVA